MDRHVFLHITLCTHDQSVFYLINGFLGFADLSLWICVMVLVVLIRGKLTRRRPAQMIIRATSHAAGGSMPRPLCYFSCETDVILRSQFL